MFPGMAGVYLGKAIPWNKDAPESLQDTGPSLCLSSPSPQGSTAGKVWINPKCLKIISNRGQVSAGGKSGSQGLHPGTYNLKPEFFLRIFIGKLDFSGSGAVKHFVLSDLPSEVLGNTGSCLQ